MDAKTAAALLEESGAVPCVQGSLAYIKELVDRCLAADVAAAAAAPAGSGKG